MYSESIDRGSSMRVQKERIPFHEFMQMISEGSIDMSSGVGFYSDGEADKEMIDIFELKTDYPYVNWYKK